MKKLNKIRLGVNVDHVATLKRTRDEEYPSLERAVLDVVEAGADQITAHLREDRRHIQDHEASLIRDLTKELGVLFNFEMSWALDIVEKAKQIRPDWVCLVPEKRQERTTEGGFDLSERSLDRLNHLIEDLKSAESKIKISLFLEAKDCLRLAQIRQSYPNFKYVDAVEIHSGSFARLFNQKQKFDEVLKEFERGILALQELNIRVHAGHGLTDLSLDYLVKRFPITEYNIGHWIIAESIFKGLKNVVSQLRRILDHKGI